MISVTDIVEAICTDPETEGSAEFFNTLHGCRRDHPWGAGKTRLHRAETALCAVVGRRVNGRHILALERAVTKLRRDTT